MEKHKRFEDESVSKDDSSSNKNPTKVLKSECEILINHQFLHLLRNILYNYEMKIHEWNIL